MQGRSLGICFCVACLIPGSSQNSRTQRQRFTISFNILFPPGLSHSTKRAFSKEKSDYEFLVFIPLSTSDLMKYEVFLEDYFLSRFILQNMHFSCPRDIEEDTRILYHYIFTVVSFPNPLHIRNLFFLWNFLIISFSSFYSDYLSFKFLMLAYILKSHILSLFLHNNHTFIPHPTLMI